MRFPISIVGAGTAGLIAARRLGELGFSPTVYDQKRILGVPVRASGILSLSGIARLGIDYSGCETNRLYGAKIYAGRSALRIKSKAPMAVVLDRKKLSDACYDQAQASGAKVITGKRLGGQVLDEMSGRGVVVGADGAVSSVARHFGFGEIGKFALTYKAEYEVEAAERGMVELFFDNGNYPGLFGWTCPNRKDLLEVGVGLYSGNGNARAAFDRLIKTEQIASVIGNRRPVDHGASMIPMRMRKSIVDERRRAMLVGDAAGQVKATTGGGIIFGGSAALMAAGAIARNADSGAPLSDYEREFRRTYGLDLSMHYMINKVYSDMGAWSMEKALSAMKMLGLDRFLSAYGDMDRPSLILKRFFLRGFAR